MRSIIFIVLILLFLTSNALSQNNANATVGKAAIDGNAPSTWELYAAVLIIVAFAVTPLLINMIMSHNHLSRMHATLDKYISTHSDMEQDKLLQIVKECINADPSGAPGTARSTMALTISLIIGICLFFLLVHPSDLASNNVVKDVILTLTGALTSIVGFYFGGKGIDIKSSETASSAPRAPEPIPSKPVIEERKVKEQKPERYSIKEDFIYQDKQYLKDTTMDLADIPENIRADWVKDKKVEYYVGQSKENIKEDLELGPGWYKIKSTFRYDDDRHIAGNIVNLNDIPASILAGWKKNGWIEPLTSLDG
jgi:hypothetical protein